MSETIRRCKDSDYDVIFTIINDGAQAYRGIIPQDRWKEPYMPVEELREEIKDGIDFWGLEREGRLLGVMGIQDRGDVTLIRHAYVMTRAQKLGIGTKLLRHLESWTEKPILIGTWAASTWAIAFYEKNGYALVSEEEKTRLLRKYWSIPERQVETSVVLANRRWFDFPSNPARGSVVYPGRFNPRRGDAPPDNESWRDGVRAYGF